MPLKTASWAYVFMSLLILIAYHETCKALSFKDSKIKRFFYELGPGFFFKEKLRVVNPKANPNPVSYQTLQLAVERNEGRESERGDNQEKEMEVSGESRMEQKSRKGKKQRTEWIKMTYWCRNDTVSPYREL